MSIEGDDLLERASALSQAQIDDALVSSGLISLSVYLSLEATARQLGTSTLALLSPHLKESERGYLLELTERFVERLDDLTTCTLTLCRPGEGSLDERVQNIINALELLETKREGPPQHLQDLISELPTPAVSPSPSPSAPRDPSQALSPPSDPPPRYVTRSLLGEGGMSTVHSALDQRLGREVALKRLKSERVSPSPAVKALFELEARVMSRLEHPNILPVYDFVEGAPRDVFVEGAGEGSIEGYTMRVARHKSLYARAVVARDLELHDLCVILRQVALALEYAHQHGVIHRDLKPHNILLGEEGEVYLTDWGVCALDPTHPDAHRVTPEMRYGLIGTPAFMAPEQVLCDYSRITPLTDVYGLGATLFCLLYGAPPFERDGLVHTMRAVRDEAPTPPVGRDHAPPPVELVQIYSKAMAKSQGDRYQSAREFANALDAFLKGLSERARREEDLQELLRRAGAEEARFQSLSLKQSQLSARVEQLREALRLASRDRAPSIKEQVWSAEEQLDELIVPTEESFARVTALYRNALSLSPKSPRVLEPLTQLFWGRYEEVERAGDLRLAAYFEARIREFGGPEMRARLDGLSEVDLSALPHGTRVEVQRQVVQRYHVTKTALLECVTPCPPLSLPRGTYALKMSHPSSDPCELILSLKRSSALRLLCRLPRRGATPRGCVYVPDPSAPLGVFHQTHHVRLSDYVDYLNALSQEDSDARAPRYQGVVYLRRGDNGRFSLPFIDAEGDEWRADWPVMMVNHTDALLYAEWLTGQTGRRWRLPSTAEWLAAAQGPDGRAYPWGHAFDSSLCWMRDSGRGRVQPAPVGSVATDVSPYGLFDVAGNMCQWTSTLVDAEREVYQIVGSSFNSISATCHLNRHMDCPASVCMMHIGVRLALTLEEVNAL